ncbi:hypothetical protein [Clostridium ihumii]|uniref:hypothetical protein n=1 Tax=Clostridium ihumii TaxID=1470356 RepID=UPI000B18FA3A|nr:hypothetical protein [Clostridium ihumii]
MEIILKKEEKSRIDKITDFVLSLDVKDQETFEFFKRSFNLGFELGKQFGNKKEENKLN